MPNNPPPTDEIVAREALEILGYTNASTISRYVALGKLTPSRRLPGRTGPFMFWRHDVQRLANEQAAERARAGEVAL